jgi:hypothetical protein
VKQQLEINGRRARTYIYSRASAYCRKRC